MESNNRILIVDDNPSIHRDFKKVLGSIRTDDKKKLAQIEIGLFGDEQEDDERNDGYPAYLVDCATQGEEALELVIKAHQEGHPYALIFMDVRMPPGWDGIETISRIWQKVPDVEIVICTAYSDYSWEKINAQLGPTDRLLFLRKPFDTTAVKQMALSQTRKWNLSQQAKRYVEQLENEIKVRKQSEERLLYLAHHDPLTGLANRTQFSMYLTEALKERSGEDLMAILFIDLDRFKEINDTLGYDNGDLLLTQIANRLKENIGPFGQVARFGGDEFAILAQRISSTEEAVAIAKLVHQTMEPHFTLSDLQLEIRASIGIVLYPEHGDDSDTLMRRADMTMSTAKKSDLGYTFYDPKFDFYSPRRLMLLGELRQAINQGDLCLYFQPKIKIATGQVIGLEGLIRWKHQRHGLIYPDEFIPLAERSGLIKPLSLWVLREAPRRWAEWRSAGLTVNVSVNLSVRDLFDITLPEQIEEILKKHEMPAKHLVLEITESTIMEDPNQVRGILQNLSGMGVRIAIDDFGTGYSSLAYLKNLPVDEIKIDKSFVLDMDKDKDDATIVRSTIELGHTLGLSVVAEGVERQEAWEMLQELGCDAAQGYFMEKPLPPENVVAWLKQSKWGLKHSNSVN